MTEQLFDALVLCETDVAGALDRVFGNDEIYVTLLRLFPSDNTIRDLESSIMSKSWDEAFTAAHALKGLAGNLGFVPLFHSVGELVIAIRAGRMMDIDAKFAVVKKAYQTIISAIETTI